MTSELTQALESLGPDPTPSQVRLAWPRIQGHLGDLPCLRVAVAASYTVEMLAPYLGWRLARTGFALSWRAVPYNQTYQQLLDPESDLRTGGADIAVILPRIEELLQDAWGHLPLDPEQARQSAAREIDTLIEASATFLSGFPGLLVAGNFVRPLVLPLGLLDASSSSGGTAFVEWVNTRWRDGLSKLPSVRILDVAGVLEAEGRRHVADPTRWFLGRIPFREIAYKAIADAIARLAVAWRRPSKKVIALDCDGTLWGGVVGEDGPDGIQLGSDAPGNAYVTFQKYLRGLQRRGILLTLCTKNNESDVWAAFDQNPGMILRKDDLAGWAINWARKSDNLRSLAKALNVGIDSVVFVDDSPVECAEVRANTPGVEVIALPEDPADFIDAVESTGLFDRLTITGEDLDRHRGYAAERVREGVRRTAGSLDDYLKTLNLSVRIFTPSAEDLPRIAQLIERTNQFNLTTRRRTEGEVRLLSDDPTMHIYAVRVCDRFGDYGLTGVAIVADDAVGTSVSIDTFVLSCRVLARGVEFALLRALAVSAQSKGFRTLQAQFVPTTKNAPAADFLSKCGFGSPDSRGWQVVNLHLLNVPNIDYMSVKNAP